MTPEELVQQRVMAYIRDRHAFEVFAGQLTRRAGGRDLTDAEDKSLVAGYQAYQRRHRTEASAAKMVSLTYGVPPRVDPAWTRIVDVKVKGAHATVTTLEEDQMPGLPPWQYEYKLERVGDSWFLTDRRVRDAEENRWLGGQL